MDFVTTDNGHGTAITTDNIPFGNRLQRVIGPFAVNIRGDGQQDMIDPVFVKQGHIIDAGKGGNDQNPPLFIDQGARRAFQIFKGTVRIQCHHQNISLGLGLLKVTNVADVNQIKAAIGQNNGFAEFFFAGNLYRQLRQWIKFTTKHPAVPETRPDTPLHA